MNAMSDLMYYGSAVLAGQLAGSLIFVGLYWLWTRRR